MPNIDIYVNIICSTHMGMILIGTFAYENRKKRHDINQNYLGSQFELNNKTI